ncbi:MazG family protein [uncultured Pseudokineococcus sp.]|uniref:MazG family protein n=1 Tax=uncultured Pseudokineococcus sp. TaxID=1642928 RepID=UPI002617F61D|nr:MazG family protein [uncultured Pseudokineococcus sp.]
MDVDPPRDPGAGLLELVAVMDRLRSPGGCPWDAEQTHASLAPYALEEAFEVVEAIEDGTAADVREELGDLLLQVVFHARVAQEAPEGERFDVDDVAAGVIAKLVSRHPHVFGPSSPRAAAVTAADVEAGWEERKRLEKGRASALDGVPVALPALARAAKVLGRARRAGLDASALLEPDADADADADVGAGAGGPATTTSGPDPARELGERLLAVVADGARTAPGVDPEGALRSAVRHLEQRARAAEAQGRSSSDGAPPSGPLGQD